MRSMTALEMNETIGEGFWSNLGFIVGFVLTMWLAAEIAANT